MSEDGLPRAALGAQELPAAIAQAAGRGWSLASMVAPAAPGGEYAVTWERRRIEQRIVVTTASRVVARLSPLALEGFEPAQVTLAVAPSAPAEEVEVAVLLERVPFGVEADGARRLIGPLPFRGPDGRLFLAHAPRPHDRGHVLSVAATGEAEDDRGSGLLAAFVWSPDRGPRTIWGVHLHPVEGDAFAADPTVQVLQEQGRPVSTQSVAMPGGLGTLSLWHEVPDASARTSGAAPRPASSVASSPDADSIAGWILSHMATLGARRAQVVVVREGVIAYARSLDAAGTEVAPQPMRVGSVSKVLLGLATAGALRRAQFERGFDTPLLELLAASRRAVDGPSAMLGRITIGQLLTHAAGLRTAPEILPDDPHHPLAEARLARGLHRQGPLAPGDLLRWFIEVGDDAVFARPPGTGRPDYGNEGAILLGEALAIFTRGEQASFGDVLARMFRAVGVEVGQRGVLFGAGLAASRARDEVPPRPTSLSWVQARFDEDRVVVPSPFGDNGPYLGAAAGVSVPIRWIGELIAAIGRPAEDPWAPTREDLERLLSPCRLDARYGHGVMLGRPAYWTFRSPTGGVPRTIRVRPAHHHGRVDGGAALHLHLVPIDPEEGEGLAVTVAFDRLGPLTAEVEGQQLLALLRAQEGRPGWGEPADPPERSQ